jgi:hypothetical protein
VLLREFGRSRFFPVLIGLRACVTALGATTATNTTCALHEKHIVSGHVFASRRVFAFFISSIRAWNPQFCCVACNMSRPPYTVVSYFVFPVRNIKAQVRFPFFTFDRELTSSFVYVKPSTVPASYTPRRGGKFGVSLPPWETINFAIVVTRVYFIALFGHCVIV